LKEINSEIVEEKRKRKSQGFSGGHFFVLALSEYPQKIDWSKRSIRPKRGDVIWGGGYNDLRTSFYRLFFNFIFSQ